MDSEQLDRFLRKHSVLEDSYLRVGSDTSQSFAPDPDDFDDDTLKKHYFLVDDATRSIPRPTIAEYASPFVNLEFAFSCHCRFSGTPLHQHDYIEMQYVYSGQCRQIIDGQAVTLGQGEFCLLDTNVAHAIEVTGEEDIIVNLLMSKHFLVNSLLPRLTSSSLIASFCAQAIHQSSEHQRYIIFHAGHSNKIRRLVTDALCEYFDKSEYASEIVNSYLVLIFSELMKIVMHDTDHSLQASLSDHKISDILRYIAVQCRDTSLRATARNFRLNPNYLSTIIKKTTGRNFRDFLQDARLKKATWLLATTTLPISEVVSESGYQNVSFFYRLFQKTYHLTPSGYRKRFSQNGLLKTVTR